DTEVIVHLYEEYGADCVQKLRGMFTFALWDTRARTLLVARDRLGIKPLYYIHANGCFAFASELKSLLQLPEAGSRLNWGSVNHLFAFLTTPAAESIIAGVHKLEPGRILILSEDQELHTRRYWDVNFQPDYGHDEQYFVERLRELLLESVKLHMVSDVPVGAFLSGGVDSSAVVAMMAQLHNRPVKTFSIGFREHDHDESRHARAVAQRFKTEHYELILDPDIGGIMESLAWHLDEPFGDPSAIPTYMVSKLAATEVTVGLSGDGGDELFAGYDKYVVESRERRYQSGAAPLRPLLGYVASVLPEGAKGRNFLRHFSLTGNMRYLDAVTLFRPEQQQQLFQSGAAEQIRHGDTWSAANELLTGADNDWLSRLQYFDLQRYLPLDILTKVDRMSMAHSLEARVPLLDHKLVEFAATIPSEFKLRAGKTKYIFKQALRGILPDSVLDRPKQGFGVPLGNWFRGQLGGLLREYLLSSRCRQRGIFNTAYIERLIKLHEGGRPLDLQLWTLLSFELWCRVFMDTQVAKVSEPASDSYLLSRGARASAARVMPA
ncbi:MAG TPA: asparagine synthase (glutamine-hydrolyzing), partial [Gammaproteobacteria bacterium]